MSAWTHEKRTASSVCSCTFEKPTPMPDREREEHRLHDVPVLAADVIDRHERKR